MMKRMQAWLAVGLIVSGGLVVKGQEVVPLPTAEEVKKQVGAGEYRDALKGLSRILALKGQAAAGYDRVEMFLLRAECQLQLKDTKSALEAVDTAYKEGVAGQKENVWEAMALAALIQNSPRMQYQPKGKTGGLAAKPINILDREARKEAYKALFEDQLAVVKAKVAAAGTARTMPPILEAAKTAGTLRSLEKAGTGDVTQSKALTEELSGRATMLLAGSVNEMSLKTDGISLMANQVVSIPVPRYDPTTKQSFLDYMTRRKGLGPEDTQTLKGVQQTCTQIIGACRDLSTLLAVQVDTYKDLAGTANSIGEKAVGLLKENFDVVLN